MYGSMVVHCILISKTEYTNFVCTYKDTVLKRQKKYSLLSQVKAT